MPDRQSDFVQRENIARFELRIKTETDPATRLMLLKLLAEEKALQPSRLPASTGKDLL